MESSNREAVRFQVMDLRLLGPCRVGFGLRIHVSERSYIELRRCRLVSRDDRPLSDPEAARNATVYTASWQDAQGIHHETTALPGHWKSPIRAEVLRTLDAVR